VQNLNNKAVNEALNGLLVTRLFNFSFVANVVAAKS
jgi:hypothetical protein